jgi:inorganic phosphate transporter, PiT family
MVTLDNKQALLSDITTVITLFFASINGLPVSTTHVKTISIIGIGKTGKAKINSNKFLNILKAWIWTFPVCGGISYMIVKTFLKIL